MTSQFQREFKPGKETMGPVDTSDQKAGEFLFSKNHNAQSHNAHFWERACQGLLSSKLLGHLPLHNQCHWPLPIPAQQPQQSICSSPTACPGLSPEGKAVESTETHLFQDVEMSLTQREDMHIYVCFTRTTNLEKMQNNLERTELCLLFKFSILLYFLSGDLKSWVSVEESGKFDTWNMKEWSFLMLPFCTSTYLSWVLLAQWLLNSECRARNLAQWFRLLSCKQKDPSLIPGTKKKKERKKEIQSGCDSGVIPLKRQCIVLYLG
ncbi:uncharacterized protein LOC110350342 [Heterocephalus glaber]|uniref:Uncharacterized protein LOC110350342 n=1 Tax=Heterocephalus glaber TaxID=10181 RepID=A0AAX6TD19_HETGA|nr:uncharacterized protein LOC110350342 [Heterocephalus glaber]